jgi:hypothetical protein
MEIMTDYIPHNQARILESYQLYGDLNKGSIKRLLNEEDTYAKQFSDIGMYNKNRGRSIKRYEIEDVPKKLLSKKPIKIIPRINR